MSNPVSVFWFNSTMTGAPALSGTAGALINVLNACLINGFGSVTLDSVVVANGVATATKSSGHGFTDYVVVVIAGATPSGLNGNKRLTWVSSTVFTFDATGISDQTATGTITAKMAPVGWNSPYTATNKAVYRPSEWNGTRCYLSVDDTAAQFADIRGFDTSMTDVDTGTQQFPYSAERPQNAWHKSATADGTARPWILVADAYAIYWFVGVYGDTDRAAFCFFGDLATPLLSTDQYHCLLIPIPVNVPTVRTGYSSYVYSLSTDMGFLARSYTQTGAAVLAQFKDGSGKTGYLGRGGADAWAYPHPIGGGLLTMALYCSEGSTGIRGKMPGAYTPWHNVPLAHKTIRNNGNGRNLLAIGIPQANNSTTLLCQLLLDITGPWR